MVVISFFLVAIIFRLIFRNLWILCEAWFLFLVLVSLWVFLNHAVSFEVIREYFFFDWLRWLLILLTFFISFLILSGRYFRVKFFKKNSVLFIFFSLVMALILSFAFLRVKPILFYIFFEASLIPIFLLIIGWGYQPERLQARVYILFYTLFASLPLLLVILLSNEDFQIFYIKNLLGEGLRLDYLIRWFFIIAFLVKLPIFGVHLWLPKAHVEAPVAGSIILAGVLLKLGRYGLWRVILFSSNYFTRFAWSLMVIGLAGGVVARFVCRVQVDMKALVAYSSVVHMGILLAGIRTLFLFGYEGALCIILGHGVVSSGLFFLVGVIYDRLGRRSLFVRKGLIVIFPSITIFWFLLRIYNIRAPPSLSLLREIFLTTSILKWRTIMFFLLILINFIRIVYTFYIYSQTQQGKVNSAIFRLRMVTARELIVAILHSARITFLVLIFWLFYLNSLIKIWNCDFQDAF